MRNLLSVLLFVGLAFLSWGIYGPVLHAGQDAMEHSSLRPFLCVGIAYFFVAVVAPIVLLRAGRKGAMDAERHVLVPGGRSRGCCGCPGRHLRLQIRRQTGLRDAAHLRRGPVVNTLVTMGMARSYRQASSTFFLGVLLVAIGAAGVLFFKPGEQSTTIFDVTIGQFLESLLKFPAVVLSISMAALCWGAYGPVLHTGQMHMGGSRLRPFLCVGLAYFAIAVVVPVAVLGVWPEPGQWTISGTLWSLAGGAAGAIGALGIILAFNFGGKPIYVMPLVFGGAPVVNTFITILGSGAWDKVPILFYVSLLMVVAGAVTVLIFAPKAGGTPHAAAAIPANN